MTEEYKIHCCNCKKDLTNLIAERFAPMVKRTVQFFLNTPGRARLAVKDAKAKTTCPACGYRHEYEVDINGLAERALERMK
jgi:hypothetical protein